MPRWTAAQILSGFALGKPLKLTDWRDDMDGQILPAQLKLREAIVQRRITDIRGRLGPPGSKERMPDDLFSDSEFMLLVTSYGTLTIHPPHKLPKFMQKYGLNLDNWWREIDFDQDEGERAISASLAPCQGQPDRSHLRLVLGARSGETETPAAPTQSASEVRSENLLPNRQPNESMVTDSAPVASEPAAARKRAKPRGPKPGTIDRYGKDDRALFKQMSALIKNENLTFREAAKRLCDKIKGRGTPESRIRRLADRYRNEVEN
jgi:hypothetical protein